ncbi:hypothetical protein BH23ACT8_BH23ACT8_06320 [soil metagenome]
MDSGFPAAGDGPLAAPPPAGVPLAGLSGPFDEALRPSVVAAMALAALGATVERHDDLVANRR